MFTMQNQGKNNLNALVELISKGRPEVDIGGLSGTPSAYYLFQQYRAHPRPFIVILPSGKAAEQFVNDFDFFSQQEHIPCLLFPAYNLLPYKFLAYHSETAAQRIGTLYRLSTENIPPVVVTTSEAVLQKVIPYSEMTDYAELVMVNEDIDREKLIVKLVEGGYNRTAIVEEQGDFSIRGGILDVFSPLYDEPIRIEFFGDMVDSLRFFSATSQRTRQQIDEVIILPAKESILKRARLNTTISNVRTRAAEQLLPITNVREIVGRLQQEGLFPGMESLLPLIYDALDTLFDYAPANSMIVLMEPRRLQQAAEDYIVQAQTNFETACQGTKLCVPPSSTYMTWEAVETKLALKPTLKIDEVPIVLGETSYQTAGNQHKELVHFTIQDNHDLQVQLSASKGTEAPLRPLRDWILNQLTAGHLTLITCGSRSQAERVAALLSPYGVDTILTDGFPQAPPPAKTVVVCIGQISKGFVWPDARLAIINERDIFGTLYRRRKKAPTPVQTQFLTLEDLKQNDLVVHLEHGIGRYLGLVKLKLDGITNDFLLVAYKDNDKLYLPVDRMNMIQKYMGVDGIAPILDKLGGKSWERVKARVKRSAEKIAGELLKIFAARKAEKGIEFHIPNRSFEEFEAAFPYEETIDQKKAIEDVIDDMACTQPMDRLVCGDVGYGKTEVALRASFVATHNGKQVAVLVPTTILAEQHFKTFTQRFQGLPFFVECLSRFRSPAEQRDIIQRLKEGKIDVVIGTHRLLSKDVTFKNLGLLILDEEQRFGVTHKEKLKKLRKTVDVLALTATPIPRTLHLSLMGIRDISVISTPPEQRHAIVTYVTEFDNTTVAEAINKELKRGGQIYFVHNHISTLHGMANKLKKIAPTVTLGIAHGQMDEEELESVMTSFMKKEIDMLVCTTIIESGIDIPSANTILINRADRFGLAQIYQLRGRVGRAEEQAYAYLFIPPDSVMTRDAQKRLKVLMEHSDLGSGFQIAMSDLKIRGGGTILGASQSGHIAAVGYDMFLKLMETAVADVKGEIKIAPLDPEINLPLSAFLPETYIPDIDQRLAAYRHLTNLTMPSELSEFKSEIVDRFGPLPTEAANLIMKIMLRILSIRSGVKRLDFNGSHLMLYFSAEHQSNPLALVDLTAEAPDKFQFTTDQALKITLDSKGPTSLLNQIKNNLKDISQRVNA